MPKKIFLYDEPRVKNFDVEEIAKYLRGYFKNIGIETRGDFFSRFIPKIEENDPRVNGIAADLVKIKVLNPLKDRLIEKPLPGEIDYERRLLRSPENRSYGILYDGFEFLKFCRGLIDKREKSSDNLHIIFTNRLLGTWDEDDKKYHARVIVCSRPSAVSLSGVVEAPAKDRDFYLKKIEKKIVLGDSEALVESDREIQENYIRPDDRRMTEIAKGYAMQAVFYHAAGNPFCKNADCRLFNAHWQREMINAQMSGDRYCSKHRKVLKEADIGR